MAAAKPVKICNNLVNVTRKYNTSMNVVVCTSILCSVEIGLVC